MVQMSDKEIGPAPLLGEFEKESVWAAKHNICQRTVARHRKRGLPYLEWGGEIYIPIAEGREYILSLLKRPNPPRAARVRRLAATHAAA
jgi:hypothetical protein